MLTKVRRTERESGRQAHSVRSANEGNRAPAPIAVNIALALVLLLRFVRVATEADEAAPMPAGLA